MLRRVLAAAAVWVVGAVVLFTVALPPEQCDADPDPGAVRDAALAAVAWIERAQLPDGSFVYEYDREEGDLGGYNVVRHAGVVMSLYQAAAAGHPTALVAADRGLAWMRERLVTANGGLALADGGRVPLGGSALLLAGLALRRDATGEPVHDELMRDVATFVVGQQRDDGSFLAEWSETSQAPVPDVTSKYFTGEAFWALGMVAAHLPGEGWDETADATAAYLATDRDRVEGFVPGVPDHWAAYGLSEPAVWPLDEAEATYAEILAGRFGFMARGDAQRTGEGLNRLVRWYPARGGGLGTVGEALGALWEVSVSGQALSAERAELEDRLGCVADLLADRQVTAEQAAGDADPALSEGAWFYRGSTRMDDQQHALSALLVALAALDAPLTEPVS